MHVETAYRNIKGHLKSCWVSVIHPCKENICVYLVKNLSARERERGAMEMKVITPENSSLQVLPSLLEY